MGRSAGESPPLRDGGQRAHHPQEAIRALVKGGAGSDDAVATIVRKIRLPRALLAGIVGACLSLAGLGFQAISRNPLADPSILGVSSGASFGLMVAMLLGVAGRRPTRP